MATLQSFSTDSIQVTPANTVSVTTSEVKHNNTVVIHSKCSLCNSSHKCCQGTVNGAILSILPGAVAEPKSVSCHFLEGKYFASHSAKVKYHIASLLRLCGLPSEQAERVSTLLGDPCVLSEISRCNHITLYENGEGEKFLTPAEARIASSVGLKVLQ